MTKNWWHFES